MSFDFFSCLAPTPLSAHFKQKDYLTWGGSVVRGDDGRYHMYVSRWPRKDTHRAWVTHSEIAHAVSANLLGPYEFRDVALGRREKAYWDSDVAHNPTCIRHQGRYYLYYNGNFGDGSYWDHRNHQRVGVAVSDSPDGPWERLDAPLLKTSPGCWDSLVTTNPSCTKLPDGRFLLMYKGVGETHELPMGGPVLHGVAFSNSPTGPFVKHPEPIFTSGDAKFPGEDPFVWVQDGRCYAILKDQGQYYSDETRALVLFESDDAINWEISHPPIVCPRTVVQEDGSQILYDRLERPQLYCEDGVPKALFVAVKPSNKEDNSFNIHIPINWKTQ